MPAVTVENILDLPRIVRPTIEQSPRPVLNITTSPRGFEDEGFPVRRAFSGIPLEYLDPFIMMDQMGAIPAAIVPHAGGSSQAVRPDLE